MTKSVGKSLLIFGFERCIVKKKTEVMSYERDKSAEQSPQSACVYQSRTGSKSIAERLLAVAHIRVRNAN